MRKLTSDRPPFPTLLALLLATSCPAAPWVPDLGDGRYKNPVLFADYSDPDVVRVGDDFYLTSSSFSHVPALPILHSRDLVNWTLVGHAAPRLSERFDRVQHGDGIWAPCLRHHDGWFWIFVGDPDRGILMTKARDPRGPWTPLHVVKAGKGLIDPSPLWDDDNRAYLVHAYAKSRAGKNSILVAYEMAPDGTRLLGEEHLVVDGQGGVHPTIEGPKFSKHDGRYYILAPAGGVKPGWQMAFRADKPFGPYEGKRVLEQGSTDINGPHQGGLVELPSGESWFLHFQDRGAYGRIVHLNPVRWVDGWPEMGADLDGNGVGEPVATHVKPSVNALTLKQTPQTSDVFEGSYNLAWQWQANPQPNWSSVDDRPGWLRLFAQPPVAQPPAKRNLVDAPHQLLQKLPAPAFTATTKLDAAHLGDDARAGLVVMGLEYAGVMARHDAGGIRLARIEGRQGREEQTTAEVAPLPERLWLRVEVRVEAVCRFSYSTDGQRFEAIGDDFIAAPGRWVGAKVGLTCEGGNGYVDFDSFRVE
ncbi:Beta-xylosidase [Posidoniimonas polymericola]|uniref:Beta-xylosidase n=1 Tax=Posidoniimonas polymericola TaxID=2528002 RepID=A0A5C5YT58_9BACT|nr:glycoside hydrolase 43 family protein [Posidoniimonas polymericola]TWT77996.1 Beta-xylosidase [Posidoniimonas polymericola]